MPRRCYLIIGFGTASAVLQIMGRAKVIYTNEHPYHVKARSNNKEWFDLSMNDCFSVYARVLEESIERYGIKLHAFVLMNNHFHKIVSTPNKNIGDFLKFFMTQTSKEIARKRQRINHIYGGRNHKNVIVNASYYAHCIKYVYRNPVKANICDKVENYKWSSIYKHNNKIKSLISPINTGHDVFLPGSLEKQLEWYNEPTPRELEDVLTKAMRRNILEVKTHQESKKQIDLSRFLYNAQQY